MEIVRAFIMVMGFNAAYKAQKFIELVPIQTWGIGEWILSFIYLGASVVLFAIALSQPTQRTPDRG